MTTPRLGRGAYDEQQQKSTYFVLLLFISFRCENGLRRDQPRRDVGMAISGLASPARIAGAAHLNIRVKLNWSDKERNRGLWCEFYRRMW